MRKLIWLCLVLSVLFFTLSLSSFAGDEAAKTVNGWVSDSMCAAKGAAPGHEACAKKCLEKGAKMVVVTEDKKVLTVDNPDALAGHEGHHVAVTGTVTGNSIHVGSVQML